VVTSRAPRRVAALLAVGAAIAAAWVAPTASASAAGNAPNYAAAPGPTESLATEPAPERAAAIAINDITAPAGSANPLADIPSDFRKVMGYQPTLGKLANGEVVAIDPNGGCSVIGGGEPFDLSTPCKSHDLGYDLLRYAHRHGDPLSTQARVQVDNKFADNLQAQCAARYRGAEVPACDAMAVTFTAGVGFNSWRQDYGPPVSKSGMVRTVGVLAFAALVLYFGLRGLVLLAIRAVRRWRRPLGLTLAVESQG
jgi:hypothetical protein